jgi:hypothetical protein
VGGMDVGDVGLSETCAPMTDSCMCLTPCRLFFPA